MFYCTSFLKDNVYYIKSLDIIAVATFDENKLHLWDVFGMNKVELDQIIYALTNSQTEEVILGFTPENYDSYQVREVSGDALFIQEDKAKLFDENELMFPLLSHA